MLDRGFVESGLTQLIPQNITVAHAHVAIRMLPKRVAQLLLMPRRIWGATTYAWFLS